MAILLVLVAGVVAGIGAVASMFGPDPSRTPLGTASSSVGSPSTSSSPSASPLPRCRLGKKPAADRDLDDWAVTLVDTTFRLPKDYEPEDLVSVARAGFPESPLKVRSLVVDDLADLREAAEDAGARVDVEAAYRSFADQASLFDRRAEDLGRAGALDRVARPGHSEHQLGTTVDFRTYGTIDVDQDWDDTPTGAWVQNNGWRYGFVQSYPKGRSAVTCYDFEPWHFRYVGRDIAARLRASGLTLREFLWDLPAETRSR